MYKEANVEFKQLFPKYLIRTQVFCSECTAQTSKPSTKHKDHSYAVIVP